MNERKKTQEAKAETVEPVSMSLIESLYLELAVNVAAEGGNDFTPIQAEIIKKWIDKALTAGYNFSPLEFSDEGFFDMGTETI